MFQLRPCEPADKTARLLLNGARLCGFDESATYELLTEAGKSPLFIDVTLAQAAGETESRTTIGRISGNRLTITVSNPSATVTTTNQTRHQIVYAPEKNLQLTFAFCCIPVAARKFLFYHEFYEEPFPFPG